MDVENEFCHLEFLVDPLNGRLQMHAMRFHPSEEPLKFFMEQVEATAKIGEEEKAFIFNTQLDGEALTTEAASLYGPNRLVKRCSGVRCDFEGIAD